MTSPVRQRRTGAAVTRESLLTNQRCGADGTSAHRGSAAHGALEATPNHGRGIHRGSSGRGAFGPSSF